MDGHPSRFTFHPPSVAGLLRRTGVSRFSFLLFVLFVSFCSIRAQVPSNVSTQAVGVVFLLRDSSGQPLATKITVAPAAELLLQTDLTNIYAGLTQTQTSSNGQARFLLWPARYSVTVQGLPRAFTIEVPESTNDVLAAPLAIGLTSYTYTNPPATILVQQGTNFGLVSTDMLSQAVSAIRTNGTLAAPTLVGDIGLGGFPGSSIWHFTDGAHNTRGWGDVYESMDDTSADAAYGWTWSGPETHWGAATFKNGITNGGSIYGPATQPAPLVVHPTGTQAGQQWTDTSGNVTASMSASGVLSANGSGLTNDNLAFAAGVPSIDLTHARLFFIGDSLTDNRLGGTYHGYTNSWVSWLTNTPRYVGVWNTNAGHGGDGVALATSNTIANILPLLQQTHIGTQDVAFIWIGANDTPGNSPWVFWPMYTNLVLMLQTNGAQVVQFTVTPRTNLGPGQETNRFTYNKWIRAAALGNYIVDPAAMFPDYTSTNDYQDGTHLTTNAWKLLAAQVDRVLLTGTNNPQWFACLPAGWNQYGTQFELQGTDGSILGIADTTNQSIRFATLGVGTTNANAANKNLEIDGTQVAFRLNRWGVGTYDLAISGSWAGADAVDFVGVPYQGSSGWGWESSDGDWNYHKLVFDQNGFLGIGTNIPQKLVHIAGSSPVLRMERPGLGSYDSTVAGGSAGTDAVDFRSLPYQPSSGWDWESLDAAGNPHKLVFDQNGYLGIGTNIPQKLVHIAGRLCSPPYGAAGAWLL